MRLNLLLPFVALFSTNVLAAPETCVIDGSHSLPRFGEVVTVTILVEAVKE